jgi:hypothetical protein
MDKHRLFSAKEWQVLQFAVIDVFMMISQIEDSEGMDEAEQNAFIDLLENPTSIEDTLLRELLASIASTWKHILDAYNSQYLCNETYFAGSFARAKALVDGRLDKDEAQSFKVALTAHLGGIIANASGKTELGIGRLSDDEVQAITAIAIWLGTDTTL